MAKYDEKKIIEAYFNNLGKRADLLLEMNRRGFKEDAMFLCCHYIDGISSIFYGRKRQADPKYFVRILKEFGRNEMLSLVHPIYLRKELLQKGAPHSTCERLSLIFPKSDRKAVLLKEEEFLSFVNPLFDQRELTFIENNLWRGTLSHIAFKKILERKMGGLTILFKNTFYKGKQVSSIDFDILYEAMRQILVSMKKLSLEAGIIFGRK